MATPYYIIEHPHRGVLQNEPNPNTGRPRFSWAKSRAHQDNAKYSTLRRAIQTIQETPDLPDGCQIIRSGGQWDVVWGG